MIEKNLSKKTKAIISKSGSGSTSTRITIPSEWAKVIGITKESKELEIELTKDNELIVRKTKD